MKIKLTYYSETRYDIEHIYVSEGKTVIADVFSDLSKANVTRLYLSFIEDKVKPIIRDCFINHGFKNGVKEQLNADFYTSKISLEV